jgi:hypothetical protein
MRTKGFLKTRMSETMLAAGLQELKFRFDFAGSNGAEANERM